jgi:hypothetical protein
MLKQGVNEKSKGEQKEAREEAETEKGKHRTLNFERRKDGRIRTNQGDL